MRFRVLRIDGQELNAITSQCSFELPCLVRMLLLSFSESGRIDLALDQALCSALAPSMASSSDSSIGYRDAGVDVGAADELIERITGAARSTAIPGVLGGLGGFGALFSLKDALGPEGFEDPVLVSGTDGVGTKLKVAFASGRHDTVGIDLVAMCINDILICGARPLFFLDYFATGTLDPGVAETVIRGIAEGCRQAECALVGGETAELPGMYADGEYDLAGFAVGVVERSRIVNGKGVSPGQAIVGVHSEGIHSNGLSLARKVLFERRGLAVADRWADDATVADILLRPTPVYTRLVRELLSASPPLAMAHITGGGIPGNLPRVMPAGTAVHLKRESWPVPQIFQRIQEWGPVDPEEMARTFNMGIGLAAVVDDPQPALRAIEAAGFRGSVIGEVRRRDGESRPRVVYE